MLHCKPKKLESFKIKPLPENDKYWYLLVKTDKPVLNVAFNAHTPRNLYLEVKQGRYTFNNNKYGFLPCSGNAGNCNDYFLAEYKNVVINLLTSNGLINLTKEVTQ